MSGFEREQRGEEWEITLEKAAPEILAELIRDWCVAEIEFKRKSYTLPLPHTPLP